MTFRIKLAAPLLSFLAASVSAEAAPTVSVSVFATAPVGASQPDSITTGDGSVWVEYGNGADSAGASGSSTIVQYSTAGGIEHTYSIPGLVDGLKFNPVTGMVWALQNNDGNSELSLINPATHTVSGPLMYASPSGSRGFDDVAFLNGKVYLSYTNPVNPTDSVVQILNQGNSPSGTLTTSSILTAQQTNPLFTSPSQPPPDTDSLKTTPSGALVLTSEGDGPLPAFATSDGRFTLISNAGTALQSVTNVQVNNATGNVNGMDDVLFPGATAGTLYVADTKNNTVYAIQLTGLDPNTPIVSLGSFSEVALVNSSTGVVGTTLLGNLGAPHGLDFVAPEPATWPLLLLGLAGMAAAATRRRSGAASRPAAVG
jgi:hypothetical protein